MAGEFGHQCVVPEGRACECGNRGCWEQYASGRVLDRWAVQAVADQPPMGEALVGAAGAPGLVDGATVGQLAALGDPIAREWLSEVGQWLGWGLANLAAVFDPAVFVVGGGLISNGDLLLDPARTAFAAALTGRGFRPETPIVPAALGSDAGIIGAAIGALDAQ